MKSVSCLACDLGAESGRLIAGTLSDSTLQLRELHRFPNNPQRGSSLTWDIPRLLSGLEDGLHKAAQSGLSFHSISTDSWGVDYILLDERGEILAPVYHYRDARTRLGVQNALTKIPWPKIFATTGIQFMPINTLFQLASEPPERLASASRILGVGDAINFFLGGAPRVEVSMASTFQLYDPVRRSWAWDLIDTLQFPRQLFPEIVPSATTLGQLAPKWSAFLGPLPVVATCSHDTGAAVAGVPATSDKPWAYLSSGTWSLLGAEIPAPIITDHARELNFTNEIGHGHSVRLLKNISGLWLVQECRREWSLQGRDFDYATLTRLAERSDPFRSLINPSHPDLLAPDSMPDAIAQFCRRTGQAVPETEGQFIRCALESLALLYRDTLRQLQTLTGQTFRRLHIVGGGSQNRLLNQFAADALNLPVIAGPAEATAAGNIVLQAIALGHIKSLAEARQIIARSFPTETFLPRHPQPWAAASLPPV